MWEQWSGTVERGRPETLVLARLPKEATSLRAPGPGPISLAEWKPLCAKWLTGRRVILHTDGAKAYRQGGKHPDGVLHDWVTAPGDTLSGRERVYTFSFYYYCRFGLGGAA